MQWLIENKEWVFSGAGIFVLSALIGVVYRRKGAIGQVQKSGKGSVNYQAGKDINIGGRDDK